MNSKLQYRIDTGDIFQDICSKWPDYNPDFVKKDLENELISVLIRKKKFFGPFANTNAKKAYVQQLVEHWEVCDKIRERSGEDAFPFHDTFICVHRGDNEIINYSESCEVTVDDPSFLLFFALKASLIDILQLKRFLLYQYLTSFKKRPNKFKTLLQDVLKKYEHLLQEKQVSEIKEALELLGKRLEILKINSIPKSMQTDNIHDANLHVKVLAMHFILEQLGYNRSKTDLTEAARFVQFLTGKELNAKSIHGTNIYKFIKNPFHSNSTEQKQLKTYLQSVKEYFEKLELPELVERVSRELSSRR